MSRLLALALVLGAFVPLAAGACVAAACAEDASQGPSQCDNPGDYGASSTTVSAPGASVVGSWYCMNDPEGGRAESSSVGASAAGVTLLYGEYNGQCFLFLYHGEDVSVLPCAVAPPNPGWGHLLP
jgi:hypothetical protein